MVTNVHERLIPVPAALVGESLDRVGSADDPWWPSPAWPPMVLEAPLGIWVRGSHGPIRYQVTEYVPGRRVVFTFDDGVGLHGSHRFEVVPQGPESCLVRHVVEGRTTGTMRLVWPLAMRWLHDAVVEDLMDRVETDRRASARAACPVVVVGPADQADDPSTGGRCAGPGDAAAGERVAPRRLGRCLRRAAAGRQLVGSAGVGRCRVPCAAAVGRGAHGRA